MKHFTKRDLLSFSNKLIKNISDPRNAKDHYQSFIIKKNRKSVKQSDLIIYQLKNFDTADKKLVIKENSKPSNKLSKMISQAEKVISNSFFAKMF